MAATSVKLAGNLKQYDVEHHVVTFTSTTATIELPTGLSAIYGMSFFRIGDVDPDDAGYLTIDETESAGAVAVTGGAVTIDRQPLASGGTLTGEKFFVMLIGRN